MPKKITIVGAGNVGSTTAQLISEKDLADVVLVDLLEGIPQGKALDIQEACPLWHSSARVIGTNSYDDTADSDIVVITAGLARKPGMRRGDLLKANAGIIKKTGRKIAASAPKAVIIVVTNPMDVMTHLAQKFTNFPSQRIIGMGGVLDSARMRTFIALKLKVHPKEVQALVLGGHGDLMVPLTRFTTVSGQCVTELLSKTEIEEIIERTRNGGAEIVGLLKTGSAFCAPAAAIVEMIETILGIKNKPLPCSVYLNGEYGVEGVYLGAPVRLSSLGVDEIVELDITEGEKQAFKDSAERVKELVEETEI
jgi:malate dehydrogenase